MPRKYSKSKVVRPEFVAVAVLVIIAGLVISVNLIQQQTSTRSEAAKKYRQKTHEQRNKQSDTVGNVYLNIDAPCSFNIGTILNNTNDRNTKFEYRFRLYKDGKLYRVGEKRSNIVQPSRRTGKYFGIAHGYGGDLENGTYYGEIRVSPSKKKTYRTRTVSLTDCQNEDTPDST